MTTPSLEDFPYQLIHAADEVVKGCGGPAALMRRKPASGEVIKSADFAHLDGRDIVSGSHKRCDTCSGVLPRRFRTKDIEPRPLTPETI